MLLRLLSVLLLVALAACASAPGLRTPAPPVPASWPGMAEAGPAPPLLHWKQFFPDPQLQQLITAALEHNRDVQIAAARVQEARAQHGLARAERLPALGLNASAAWVSTPAELLGSGVASTSQRYDLGLSLPAYELDLWGRLARLDDAARYNLLSGEAARRAVQLALIGEVASSYYTCLLAQELGDLARTTLALRTQTLELVAQGRDAGAAPDLDYQHALALQESALASLEGAQHQHHLALNRIAYLLGYAALPEPVAGSLHEQGQDNDLVPGLPSEVLLARPDVLAAEHRLRAAHANIAAARAAFLPRIALTASAGLASQALSGLFQGAAWAFQPAISMPLFDGGRLRSGVELAEARKDIAVAEYEKALQQAFREVADLLSARVAVAAQLRGAQANRRAQGRMLAIAQARFDAGLASYLDVLEAQRGFVAASENVLQLRRAQLETAAQLYKALGGGGTL